jgi:hypothetical protein
MVDIMETKLKFRSSTVETYSRTPCISVGSQSSITPFGLKAGSRHILKVREPAKTLSVSQTLHHERGGCSVGEDPVVAHAAEAERTHVRRS